MDLKNIIYSQYVGVMCEWLSGVMELNLLDLTKLLKK